jgi:serine protease Do
MKNLSLCILLVISISLDFQAQDLSSLYQESIKSVVTIFTTEFKFAGGRISPNESLGSGVIIDAKGHIMTAAHVIESANLIKIKLYNGNTYDAEIIRSIPSADIALLKIKEGVPGLNPAKINPGYTEA